ncbi:MAG: hypothetical protein RR585_08865 [Coprobacillus sp.]
MNGSLNYEMWIILDRILINLFFVFCILRINHLSLSQKKNVVAVFSYFVITLIFVKFIDPSLFMFRNVFDLLLGIYLANDKRKTIYSILVIDIFLEIFGYIVTYYSLLYTMNVFVFYIGPILLTVILWSVLYYTKLLSWMENNLQLVFNGVVLLGWILIARFVLQFTLYDIGMINYVYGFLVVWFAINLILSRKKSDEN